VVLRNPYLTRPFFETVVTERPFWLALSSQAEAVQRPGAARVGIVLPAPVRWLTRTTLPPPYLGERRWYWQGWWWTDVEMLRQQHHWIQVVMWWLQKLPAELVRELVRYYIHNNVTVV
jgi:hypothetical protein